MAVAETRSATGSGGACSVAGGLLIVLGYWLPWITYHLEGGALNLTDNGWQAVLNSDGPLRILRSIAAGDMAVIAVAGVVLLIVSFWPVVVGLAAVYMGARSVLSTGLRPPKTHSIANGALVIAGVVALLILTYALDPFGHDPSWMGAHDPVPTIGPGLYAVFIGMAAVVVGALISHQTR